MTPLQGTNSAGKVQANLTRQAKRSMAFGGSAVLIATAILALISLGLVPGVPIRVIDGSTATNQALGIGGAAFGAFIGISFISIAAMGMEDMRIEGNSIVLPVRRFGDLVRNRSTRLRIADIEEAVLKKNTRGTALVEFVMKRSSSRSSTMSFTLGWAKEPDSFISELERAVRVRRERGWEELWHKWRTEGRS